MSDTLTLSAGARERAGKGASRAMRREGRVPAVIYGARRDPVAIHVEEKALVKALSTGHFMNTVTMIALDGGRTTRTLPKDVQFHPVSDRPLHVDFFRIDEHSMVTVGVPVRFADEEAAPGIERGGVLNVVRHELELSCEAGSIPAEIVISLSGLEVGGSIHISDVTLPEGVTSAIDDRDFTIATVVAPSAMKADEQAIAAEEEAAAEAASAEATAESEPTEGEPEAE